MDKSKLIKNGLAGVFLLAAVLLTPFEGLQNKAYVDPVGVPTICWGHTKGVTLKQTASDQKCIHYLKEDLAVADAAISQLVKVPLTDEYRSALLSFVLNVGQGNFSHSTLLKRLNKSDYAGGCEAIAHKSVNTKTGKCEGYGCGWGGSKQLKGLQDRRIAEQEQCLKGIP